jgi:hypothetical protein
MAMRLHVGWREVGNPEGVFALMAESLTALNRGSNDNLPTFSAKDRTVAGRWRDT